ncbi:DoxX family protein [Streptomyces bobili]|uniref:DoxX family protein n=1 Tax=Streptomyces bobili TaxID=67280 RepID=UPI0036F89C4C
MRRRARGADVGPRSAGAAGLAVTMFGAGITHSRRGELQSVVLNVVLLALTGSFAWGRFGPYPF